MTVCLCAILICAFDPFFHLASEGSTEKDESWRLPVIIAGSIVGGQWSRDSHFKGRQQGTPPFSKPSPPPSHTPLQPLGVILIAAVTFLILEMRHTFPQKERSDSKVNLGVELRDASLY